MQALSYRIESVPEVSKKPKPRKPTLNQTNTRYSRSNLAWLVKEKDPITKTKRFEKDLKKYYTGLDELINEYGIK